MASLEILISSKDLFKYFCEYLDLPSKFILRCVSRELKVIFEDVKDEYRDSNESILIYGAKYLNIELINWAAKFTKITSLHRFEMMNIVAPSANAEIFNYVRCHEQIPASCNIPIGQYWSIEDVLTVQPKLFGRGALIGCLMGDRTELYHKISNPLIFDISIIYFTDSRIMGNVGAVKTFKSLKGKGELIEFINGAIASSNEKSFNYLKTMDLSAFIGKIHFDLISKESACFCAETGLFKHSLIVEGKDLYFPDLVYIFNVVKYACQNDNHELLEYILSRTLLNYHDIRGFVFGVIYRCLRSDDSIQTFKTLLKFYPQILKESINLPNNYFTLTQVKRIFALKLLTKVEDLRIVIKENKKDSKILPVAVWMYENGDKTVLKYIERLADETPNWTQYDNLVDLFEYKRALKKAMGY